MYISLGVGRLALLILTWGQCEGLTAGISTKVFLPRLFVSILSLTAEVGRAIGTKTKEHYGKRRHQEKT